MANTVKTKAQETVAKTEAGATKVTVMLRKGVLAYIGLHGAAFERAQTRLTKTRTATDGLFESFVVKGEKMEAQAGDFLKGTQSKVTETYKKNAQKVREILPTSANDRVEELEAEIAALNKKIVAVSKKVRPAAKAKTEKTAPAASEETKAA